MAADAILARLGSSQAGLSSADAAERAARLGPNRLREEPGVPVWRLLLDEVLNPLVLILLAAVAVLVAVSVIEPADSRWGDAGLIIAIVVLNGALGFVQNYRAQRGIEALRRLEVPEVRIVRDGSPQVRSATELVLGDVIMLEEGDRIPADARLLRAHDLRVDESSLTGESEPVDKFEQPMAAATPLADRRNMVFLGTAAVAGRATAVVTGIGMATEVGAIASAVQAVEEGATPFQREVATLGRRITAVIGVLIALIALLQLTIGGRGLLETFIAAVALAVAAIPEGLPVVMTLALAFGTRRMLERHALVRSLPVVEIVGGADVVCTDKTGTITEGRMSLRRLYADGRMQDLGDGEADRPPGGPALLAAGLCNNARLRSDGGFMGDPTEVALLDAAARAGLDLDAWERVEELPFSSERKRMSVVVRRHDAAMVLAKGAPEVLLPRCSRLLRDGRIAPLVPAELAAITEAQAQLTDQAFRVLALGGKAGAPESRDRIETDLVFYGLAALADPPRSAAAPALQAAQSAGIRVVMITGDHARTAAAVGTTIGLGGRAVEGRELEGLTDEAIVESGEIFARVEPVHKLRILDAFRRTGHIVVMTGDGVNDAPALKGADVGIAMGLRGTDVARDASDMVLLDDNFATIVAAIEEGRRIAANIRKFLNYLLSGNLAEVLLILVASLFGQLPITAVQILWVNLVTDSGPAVALAVDPAAPGIMDQGPRRGPIIGRAMLALVTSVGAIIAAIVLGTFAIGLAAFDMETARTMTFTALVVQEYLRLLVIRVHEGSPLLANRWLVVAVLVSLALQLALIYSPLGGLFGTVPLPATAWAVIVAGIGVGFPAALGATRLVRQRFGAL
jgi:P-type Ca2+ transporter type 2C